MNAECARIAVPGSGSSASPAAYRARTKVASASSGWRMSKNSIRPSTSNSRDSTATARRQRTRRQRGHDLPGTGSLGLAVAELEAGVTSAVDRDAEARGHDGGDAGDPADVPEARTDPDDRRELPNVAAHLHKHG